MNSRPHGLQRMPCRLIRVARSRKVTPFLRKLAEEKVNLIFQYGRLHGRQPGYSGIRVLACFLQNDGLRETAEAPDTNQEAAARQDSTLAQTFRGLSQKVRALEPFSPAALTRWPRSRASLPLHSAFPA